MTHLRDLASLVVSAVLLIIALWSAGAMVGIFWVGLQSIARGCA